MTESIKLDAIDQQIYECLNPTRPKSFFLFAGAGSGKTRSLVNILKMFRIDHTHRLLLEGQQVAVITYTNAACDEIKSRLEYDACFSVSTIHSFAWELCKPYKEDIKKWLTDRLIAEIADLEEKQSRGRAGSKAAIDRPRQIEAKNRRLSSMNSVHKFVYSPDGNNTEWNSLNHTEVISMTAEFLKTHRLFRKILIHKHPILLIDESQDTNKDLMESFFHVQGEYASIFTLGLFGDRMQRIYFDGKRDLGDNLPPDWMTPKKIINYRCPKRVIKLINQIRNPFNDSPQEPGPNNIEGIARLFLANINSEIDKTSFESWVSTRMAEITKDESWAHDEMKVLTLEHLMAARRGGFEAFFKPLYAIDRFKTGLLNGKLSGLALFTDQVLPVVEAMRERDKFEIARIVRKSSHLLNQCVLNESDSQAGQIKKANDAVNCLMQLWSDRKPTLYDILKNVHQSGLFPIPERLLPIAKRLASEDEALGPSSDNKEVDHDEEIDAWDEALKSSLESFKNYVDYISGNSRFGTHQGIKGLEFPRVMVVLDDNEAGGRFFSYEKLLGVKESTSSDRSKGSDGEETSIDRTRRLFYVTCSRAEKSLAVIAYTADPEKVKKFVIENGWFTEAELIAKPSDFGPQD